MANAVSPTFIYHGIGTKIVPDYLSGKKISPFKVQKISLLLIAGTFLATASTFLTWGIKTKNIYPIYFSFPLFTLATGILFLHSKIRANRDIHSKQGRQFYLEKIKKLSLCALTQKENISLRFIYDYALLNNSQASQISIKTYEEMASIEQAYQKKNLHKEEKLKKLNARYQESCRSLTSYCKRDIKKENHCYQIKKEALIDERQATIDEALKTKKKDLQDAKSLLKERLASADPIVFSRLKEMEKVWKQQEVIYRNNASQLKQHHENVESQKKEIFKKIQIGKQKAQQEYDRIYKNIKNNCGIAQIQANYQKKLLSLKKESEQSVEEIKKKAAKQLKQEKVQKVKILQTEFLKSLNALKHQFRRIQKRI